MRLPRPRRRLQRYFEHNDGRLIHKWMHYFPIYERHFARFVDADITFLEIGVFHGGSLQMWKHYFGRRARIVGADIDPRTGQLGEDRVVVEIGDQSDPAFLAHLVDRHGPFDMVLDDGGHHPAHQIASVEALWPFVSDGGVYMIEDVHTSYMSSFGQDDQPDRAFITWLADRVDDLHAFHTDDPTAAINDWTRTIASIHTYDSIVVLEKGIREAPVHRKTGRPSFPDIAGALEPDPDHQRQLDRLNRLPARLRRIGRDPRGSLERARARFGSTT